MTAHALKGDRERCLKAGMDAYLSKPVQAQALYDLIEGIAPSERVDNDATSERADQETRIASVPSDSVMDWVAALEQLGGNETLLRELAPLFFGEADQLLPELREAISLKDANAVQRLGHTLKGAASHFAADPAMAAAARLESMGRDKNLTGANEAYELLEREVERLQQALANYVQD
jgi:HPt (histidine-containing phosphotransfer) domain-containing protein